jgi:hypothetical protein
LTVTTGSFRVTITDGTLTGSFLGFFERGNGTIDTILALLTSRTSLPRRIRTVSMSNPVIRTLGKHSPLQRNTFADRPDFRRAFSQPICTAFASVL